MKEKKKKREKKPFMIKGPLSLQGPFIKYVGGETGLFLWGS